MRKILACIALLLFALVSSTSAMAQRETQELYTYTPPRGMENEFFRVIGCTVIQQANRITIERKRVNSTQVCEVPHPTTREPLIAAYFANGRWLVHEDMVDLVRGRLQRQGRPWPFDTVRL